MADRALEAWEGRHVADWRALWKLPELHILENTTSTSDRARERAADGALAGTMFLAEHQTAGRGRLGRAWADQAGQSLLFSIVLRPRGGDAPGTAPLRIGMAVAGALRDTAGIDARVKWPNDVTCDDRKLAGILCEAATAGGDVCIIAGIGINVTQRSGDLDVAIRSSASSVAMAAGSSPPRGAILTEILDRVRPLFERSLDPLSEAEMAAFSRMDALAGRPVSVDEPARARGIARGTAADGALLLETGHQLRRVTSATVRLIEHVPDQPAPRRP